MSASDDVFAQPDKFPVQARLFPLPNLVMFPHVLQPLHIFEPRYRAMVEAALADDGLIAMALLAPGWEADYEGRPALEPMACVGRITMHQRLENGRFNILLAGLNRVRIVGESPSTKLFREAQVELCEDFYSPAGSPRRAGLQRRLLEMFSRSLPDLPECREQLESLLAGDVCLGTLTDIIAYALDLTLPLKERLLAETDVDRRAALLVAHLERGSVLPTLAGARSPVYPPGFSEN